MLGIGQKHYKLIPNAPKELLEFVKNFEELFKNS